MFPAFLKTRSEPQSSSEYKSLGANCSKRIQKLRHNTQSVIPPARSGAYKTREVKHPNVLFLQAERCWSQAQYAILSNPKNRHFILSKFRKAIVFAKHGLLLDKSKEYEVYKNLLTADLYLYQKNWEEAANSLSLARVGLTALNNPDFSLYIPAKIDPDLKLSLVQLGKDRKIDLVVESERRARELGLVVDQSKQQGDQTKGGSLPKEESLPSTVQFLQFTAKIPYIELAQLIAKAQSSSNVENWDLCWSTAANLKADLDHDDDSQDLDILISYAKFEMLKCAIQSDLAIESNKNLKVYDKMAVNAESMAELPGVHQQQELVEQLKIMANYFRAKQYIAVVTDTSLSDKFTRLEVLSLANHAHELVHNSEMTDDFDLPIKSKEFRELKREIHSQLSRAYGVAVIQKQVWRRSQIQGSFASNLGFWQEKPNLPIVDLNAKDFTPVPLKPVFYDIAFNLAMKDQAEPDSMDTSEGISEDQCVNETKEELKKRFFGIF